MDVHVEGRVPRAKVRNLYVKEEGSRNKDRCPWVNE